MRINLQHCAGVLAVAVGIGFTGATIQAVAAPLFQDHDQDYSKNKTYQQGMREGRDYRTLRFDSDLGKHGDTGTSEVEVARAVLDGRADAGAIGSPFWNTVRSERLVPEGSLREVWSSPAYNHCMFTARPDLDPELERPFADALSAMSYDNPAHRLILDAEGLQRWLPPQLDGYTALRQAAAQQGFFNQLLTRSA